MGSKESYTKNRERVFEIYGNRCANFDFCGKKSKPTGHHIVFKSDRFYVEGGKNSKANIIPLCRSCQSLLHSKVAKMEEEYLKAKKSRK